MPAKKDKKPPIKEAVDVTTPIEEWEEEEGEDVGDKCLELFQEMHFRFDGLFLLYNEMNFAIHRHNTAEVQCYPEDTKPIPQMGQFPIERDDVGICKAWEDKLTIRAELLKCALKVLHQGLKQMCLLVSVTRNNVDAYY